MICNLYTDNSTLDIYVFGRHIHFTLLVQAELPLNQEDPIIELLPFSYI